MGEAANMVRAANRCFTKPLAPTHWRLVKCKAVVVVHKLTCAALLVGGLDNRLMLSKNKGSGDHSAEVLSAAELDSADHEPAGSSDAGTSAAAAAAASAGEPAAARTDARKDSGSAKKLADQHPKPQPSELPCGTNGQETRTLSPGALESRSSSSEVVLIWPQTAATSQKSSQELQQPAPYPPPEISIVPSSATLAAAD